MAPAAQAPLKRAAYDGSRPRFSSIEAWLNSYGNAEYAIYKRDAAPNPMSYEEWTKSEHVLGPFLWYTTLDVWEEDSSSEGESETEGPKVIAQAPSKPQPKKLVILNGGKKRNSAKSAASPTQSTSGDAAIAAKRKRKAKKPYLSEDIVVSDISDEPEEPDSVVEAQSFAVNDSVSPGNGRRKSGGRKKKQYLSAEIISPEDEDEDHKPSNGTATIAVSPREPSAPVGNHTPIATTSPGQSKSKRGKKLKKKPLSHSVVLRDDEDSTDFPSDAVTTPKNAAASPEGPGSSSRRGLRTRTPAQQRPYFHNAQAFDDLVSDGPEPESDTKLSNPKPKSKPKLKLTNLANVSYIGESEEIPHEHDETVSDDVDIDEDVALDLEESQPSRKAHYKGKGRAWKKTSDDEDEDYKSPVKVKSGQPKRKLGPRKSNQTADIIPEIEEGTELQQQEEEVGEEGLKIIEPPPNATQKASKRKQRRVHNLSEEFVMDEDDLENMSEGFRLAGAKDKRESEDDHLQATRIERTPKKKGRPRKSDQDSTSPDSTSIDNARLASSNGDHTTKEPSPPSRETLEIPVEAVPLSNSKDQEKGSEAEEITEGRQVKGVQSEEKGDAHPKPPSAESDQVAAQ